MSRSPTETPYFLRLGDEHLFAVMHEAAGEIRGGFLFCHPLGEEKLWAHRVHVSFARELAAAGWAVLRIDFRGEGDSARDFASTDVHSRVEDTQVAIADLRRQIPVGAPVTLLGLRFGATIAALAAAGRGSGVDHLVLWDPIVKGAPYMQSVLMTNLTFQMALHRKVVQDRKALVEKMRAGETVSIEGYSLGWRLYEQACAVDLTASIAGFEGPGLVVQIGPEGAPERREFQEIVARCPGLRLARAVEEPFWKEIKTYYQRADRLAAVTSDWLKEVL